MNTTVFFGVVGRILGKIQDVNRNGSVDPHHAGATSAAAPAVGGAMATGIGAVGAIKGSSKNAIVGATPAGGSQRGEIDAGAD